MDIVWHNKKDIDEIIRIMAGYLEGKNKALSFLLDFDLDEQEAETAKRFYDEAIKGYEKNLRLLLMEIDKGKIYLD